MSWLPQRSETLWIYPNRHAQSRAWQHESRILDGQITFDALFMQLGSQPQWHLIDSMQASLVVRHLLSTTSLPYRDFFGIGLHDVVGIQNITRSLLELRAAGITAEALAAQPNTEACLCLSQLLAGYTQFLAQRHWYDEADQQRQAVFWAATEGLPAAWSHIRTICVQPGTEVLGARLDLLSAWAKQGLEVIIRIPWDPSRPDAFAWTDAMLHAIETRGHPALSIEHDSRIGTGPLQNLRQALYTSDKVTCDAICVTPASRGHEHVDRCVQVVHAWLTEGIGADQIAVVLPDPDGQRTKADAQTLEHALTQAGIYNRCTFAQSLWQNPVAHACVTWLRLAPRVDRGLTRSEWMQLWRFWGHDIQTETQVYSVTQIAACLATAATPRWAVDELQTLLSQMLPASFVGIPNQETNIIVQAVQTRCAMLQAINHALHVSELDRVMQIFWDHLDSLALKPDDVAAIRRVIVSWQQHLEAIDPQATIELTDVAQWLMSALKQVPQDQTHDASGAIDILTPDAVVGSRYSHILFVGANQGIFPRPAPFDPILTDAVRHQLNTTFGPKLLQYTASSGRGALAAQARDRWLGMEILFACTNTLNFTLVTGQEQDGAAPSEWIETLQAHCDLAIKKPCASYAALPQASNSNMLRYIIHQNISQKNTPKPLRLRRSRIDARIAHTHACLQKTAEPLTAFVTGCMRKKLEHEVQSASQLDILAQCTYKFFTRFGLNLNRQEAQTFAWTAAQKGSMTHAALHAVYDALEKHGGLPFARRQRESAKSILRQAFIEYLEKKPQGFFGHASLQSGIAAQMWDAIEIQFQRDLLREETEILALEFRFGGGHDTQPVLTIELPKSQLQLQVRGIIDRVEYNPATRTLETFDYKSSAKKKSVDRHFQLGIYALAANQSLLKNPLWLSTAWLPLWKDKAILAPITQDNDKYAEPGRFTEALTHNLDARISALLEGQINRDIENIEDCQNCDVLSVCRFGYQSSTLQPDDAINAGDSESSHDA